MRRGAVSVVLRFALSLAFVVVASVASVVPRAARADATQARIHFERGKTYFEVDEYRKAIEEFKAAHIEKSDPAFLYNIAECYRHLGEPREALVFYRRFLSAAPASDRSRPIVERRIADLQSVSEEKPTAVEPAKPSSPAAPAPSPPALAISAPADPPAAALVQSAGSSGDETAATRDEPAPLYARGWFIVAASVLVVAAGVGVWALTRDSAQPPGTPLGNMSAFKP